MQVLHPACRQPLCAPLACPCRQQFPIPSASFYNSNLLRHLGSAHGHCACLPMQSSSGGSPTIRQTATHLFEDEAKIGKGGSCDVYLGVEKGTGTRHALKVLRESDALQQSLLLKEAKILSTLCSSKIVQFYGHSFEPDSGRPVVAIEYCNGGSLLSFLQQPENARGLDDDVFRTLLSDLVEGLRCLRDKCIVHRDIKPGNILRHLLTSGKCEYKLSDFGTSREATDTEQMTSIVGTEEYLHPVMFKNAFFGNKVQSILNPTSGELWSIGCTLYHAMTASVPFRPLGGTRNNRKAMLVMISQKPSGAISGDQMLDGNFRWSKTVSTDCRMSESLREKFIPLLQNLLETDASRQWTFETFLHASQRILDMRRFHVCDTECGDVFQLYMEPRQSLAEVQDALAFHTEVPACQQLLFHRVQSLLSMLSAQAFVSDLPITQSDQPLLLVTTQGAEGRCRRQMPVLPGPMLPETMLDEDVTSAFKICSDLHQLFLIGQMTHRLPNFLFSAILAVRSALTSTLSTVETRFRVISATCQERQSRLAMLTNIQEILCQAPSGGHHTKLCQASQLCDQLRDDLWRLKYGLDEFRKSADLVRFDNPLPDDLHRDDSSVALKHIFTCAKDLWRNMQERKQKIPLSSIEQEKHKGDKASLDKLCTEACNEMKGLQGKRAKLLQHYCQHIRQLYDRLLVSQQMDARLQDLKEESEKFSNLLNQIWTSLESDLRGAVGSSRSGVIPQTATALQTQLGDLLSEGLPTLETFTFGSPVSR